MPGGGGGGSEERPSLNRSRTGAPRGARGLILLRSRPREDMGAFEWLPGPIFLFSFCDSLVFSSSFFPADAFERETRKDRDCSPAGKETPKNKRGGEAKGHVSEQDRRLQTPAFRPSPRYLVCAPTYVKT